MAVGRQPAASPPLDSLILSMNFIRKMEAKRGTLCVLPRLLIRRCDPVTTGKCDSSRSTSGTPTRRKRETESRTSNCRRSWMTQAALIKRNTGHLASHAQRPRKETIPASQRENRGSEQWKVPPKSGSVSPVFDTGLYICTGFILYTLYALPHPQGTNGNIRGGTK